MQGSRDFRAHRYFVIPHRALQPYIDRLWGWESEPGLQLPPMLPGTGAELMFHYADPVLLRRTPQEVVNLGAAFLPGARGGARELLAQGRVGFISVRFRSGALRHFSPLPLAELAGQPLTVDEVWGAAGCDLAECIASAPDRATRVALLEDWLLSCLSRHGKPQPVIEAAIRALYYRHQSVTIAALADELGMSQRHFERVFHNQVGVTPKTFQRTARFQLTVRDLLLAEGAECLGTVLDHGYYDQAHFIHDFEAFVGQAPTGFLQTTRAAHFYNPPLFSPDKVPLPR